MEFKAKVFEGPQLWITFWCKRKRIASLNLDREQGSAMLWMLDWHLGTDAPGNFIKDDVGGVCFLSEGKGDLFAIASVALKSAFHTRIALS